MLRLLRLLRRRRLVIVDEEALRRMAELAVVGAAYEVIEAESERWYNLS